MKKVVLIIPSLFLLFLYGCPSGAEYTEYVDFFNNSDNTISYSFESGTCYGIFFPDTLVPNCRPPHEFTIAKGSEARVPVTKLSYIYEVQKTDTLCFFIFDTDTINHYDWETIRNEYKILQRYDLSLQDFKRLEYTITYPPSEAMKNVKMYPPYGQ
jgi:hypothetical protein